MLSHWIVRGEVNRRWRPLVAPLSLIRSDRARPIDRVIDYFGGADQRTASVAPFRTHPVPGPDEQTKAVRR
jgi:hypothetical protein